MNKPVILHTINTLGVGGAEVLFKNSINLLTEFHHVIVYLNAPHTLQHEIKGDVEFICLHHTGWKHAIRTIGKLRKLIRNKNPRLVHSHLFEATLFSRLATPRRIPLITTLHSMFSVDAFTKNKLSLWVERMFIRDRQQLIAVSGYVLKDYLSWVPFKGSQYILYNFLPESFFRSASRDTTDSTLKCVAVGNLKEAKNYFYLLHLFEALKDKNITLDIYGVGFLFTELQNEIAEKQLKVKLCGKGNVPDILSEYDLFIQASLHEGFGIAVIEAMAMSLPVLISDIPVFREITLGHAHFFELDHPEAAVLQLERLAADQSFRKQHVIAAFNHVKNNFSSAVYKKKIEEIYQSIL